MILVIFFPLTVILTLYPVLKSYFGFTSSTNAGNINYIDIYNLGFAGLGLTAVTSLGRSIKYLMASFTRMEKDCCSIYRLFEYLPEQTESSNNINNTIIQKANNLRIKEVEVRLGLFESTLTSISATASIGDRIGLVGRTGSGKSTLIGTK